VSIHASPERAEVPLEVIQRRAGAVTVSSAAGAVVLNYGSAAGELAACVTAAGMADCSWLSHLELSGPIDLVDDAVRGVTGSTVAAGGALPAVSAWWCGSAGGRVIVLCERAIGERLRGLLDAFRSRDPRLRTIDRSSEWATLAVVGRRAGHVLTTLGVYGAAADPRSVPPFAAASAGLVPARWLLASDHRAVALVPRVRAGEAWQAIERAGRSVGICCVGRDALERYAVLDRRSASLPR
jgi:glycine cleavage system aminomethyltransferase T